MGRNPFWPKIIINLSVEVGKIHKNKVTDPTRAGMSPFKVRTNYQIRTTNWVLRLRQIWFVRHIN
jgi:hypothetical protein